MYGCTIVAFVKLAIVKLTDRLERVPWSFTSMHTLTSESQELREIFLLPTLVVLMILMESTYMPHCGHWKRTTSVLPTPVLSGRSLNLNSMPTFVVDCRVSRSLAHMSSSLSMNSGTTPSRRTLEVGLKQTEFCSREQFPILEDPFTATAEEGMTNDVGKTTRREIW